MSSSRNNFDTISLFDVVDDHSCVSSSGTKIEVEPVKEPMVILELVLMEMIV